MARRGVIYAVSSVAARRERDLGRNRRWAGARDAGRRKDLDERDAAGAARMGQGVADRRRPRRCEHRVHRRERDPPRRHAPAHLSYARRRPHLDAHRQGHQRRWARSTWSAKIPKQRGLLFAGTEREVVFSADDGDHWQTLRMNMPASSIRDLVIKDDDLVIGTHGRSIWILDNIAPLRQLAEATRASGAFCSRRRAPRGSGGTCSPTRRCRLRSRPARIRQTARSSTITCHAKRKTSRSRSSAQCGEVIRQVLERG